MFNTLLSHCHVLRKVLKEVPWSKSDKQQIIKLRIKNSIAIWLYPPHYATSEIRMYFIINGMSKCNWEHFFSFLLVHLWVTQFIVESYKWWNKVLAAKPNSSTIYPSLLLWFTFWLVMSRFTRSPFNYNIILNKNKGLINSFMLKYIHLCLSNFCLCFADFLILRLYYVLRLLNR